MRSSTSSSDSEPRVDKPQLSTHATTDPQDELFELLDAAGRQTGVAKRRGDVHRDGDWHGALHLWVGGVGSDGVAFVLLQRRSQTKDTWPGALDVAVGGHIRAGETLADAIREADEEIGLPVTLDDVVRLGRRFAHSACGTDNEVQEVFAHRSDRRPAAYRLHPQEVDALVSVPVDAAIELFEGRSVSARGVELRRGASSTSTVEVTVAGFAAGDRGGYPALALRGLREVLAGRVPKPFELR